MAIKYGLSDKRSGKVGDLVFSLTSAGNVVKEKTIKVNDAKSIGQVEQRSKMANIVKALKDLDPAFIKRCFEKKSKATSYSNTFVSENVLGHHVCSFFKKYSDDPNIIGIGQFVLSKGSLAPVPVVEFTANEVTYYGVKLEDTTDVSANTTVAQVSTSLTKLYPTVFKAGYYVNAIALYNTGVSYKNDDEDPLTVDTIHVIEKSRGNFIVNTTNNKKISEEGFLTIKDGNNHVYLTLCKNRYDRTISNGVKKTGGVLGYCGFFVAMKNGSSVKVSTCQASTSDGLASLITKINANPVTLSNGWLSTVMKILIVLSYGIKKTVEIIRDFPI
jgi:hypothetical protein